MITIKKISIFLIATLLFWISYQVRLGFLATHDYTEPSDAREYWNASGTVAIFLRDVVNEKKLVDVPERKRLLGELNVHGTPLYVFYLAILRLLGFAPPRVAAVLGASLVLTLFVFNLRFLSFPIALMIAIISSIYTPLFAFTFSRMPESFTAIVIPPLLIVAAYLAEQNRSSKHLLIVGLLLATIGFARHIFTWYGLFFITLWWLTVARRSVKRLVILLGGYLAPTLLWTVLIRWSGVAPYTQDTILSTIYHAHNLGNDGWGMDGIRGLNWPIIFRHIFFQQNLLNTLALELNRISRFWSHPANTYTTDFPLTARSLNILHGAIIFLAAWGLRQVLKRKLILLIASIVIWNTMFVIFYYLEELRLQIPVLGLVFVIAAFGISEISDICRHKKARIGLMIITFSMVTWYFFGTKFLALELWLVPMVKDVTVFRNMNLIVAITLMVVATILLWQYDCRTKLIARNLKINLIYTLIPFIIFFVISVSEFRNRLWHEWVTPLAPQQKIQQTINLDPVKLKKLVKEHGYLLVDSQDFNAAEHLLIKFNNKLIQTRLSMNKTTSPVDLMAMRQWQKTMSHLGSYGPIEPVLATASAWPDFHNWLVMPIPGTMLEEVNIITLENNNDLATNLPIIYGDFLTANAFKYYEGPSARIFSGKVSHNRYQVEQDLRIPEIIELNSVSNASSFFLANGTNSISDLSTIPGKQTGRYRIFLLFPFKSTHPETIF